MRVIGLMYANRRHSFKLELEFLRPSSGQYIRRGQNSALSTQVLTLARVASFILAPCNQLDEAVVQNDASGCVEDRAGEWSIYRDRLRCDSLTATYYACRYLRLIQKSKTTCEQAFQLVRRPRRLPEHYPAGVQLVGREDSYLQQFLPREACQWVVRFLN